jgi:hypothetical protein
MTGRGQLFVFVCGVEGWIGRHVHGIYRQSSYDESIIAREIPGVVSQSLQILSQRLSNELRGELETY